MRKNPLTTGRYYHIYNRGVDKRDIFMNRRDLDRFILSVKLFNVVNPIGSIKDRKDSGVGHLEAEIGSPPVSRLVSIMCYCFNPNHFHFIVRQEVDGGISEFFKRLLGGYTNYFNKVHSRSGVLFQGKFKSSLIAHDQYFLKIGPYVNMNYAVHDIPPEKNHLVAASDKEYDSRNFDIISRGEAKYLLDFYKNEEDFKNESIKTISIIRKERGKTSLLDEDFLP